MSDNTPCVDIPSIKHYPVASSLPAECPVITPSIDERSVYAKYKKRDYINEQTVPSKTDTDFTPVHSSTPTPTVTPTNTPTPSITPTITPTPDNSSTPTPTPTPTHTCTPTVTPTHKPKIVFQMFVNMTIFTEVQFVYSFLTREVMLFHAVNGPFPLNPIGFTWRVTQDGIITESGSAEWNIAWRMTRYDANRFYQTDSFLAAAAIGYVSVVSVTAAAVATGIVSAGAASSIATGLALAGPAGWIAAGVLAALALFLNLFGIGHKSQPPEQPRPQWADPKFVIPINTSVVPLSPDKFKFIPGTSPDSVMSGGIAVEYPPEQANLWNVTIAIKDSSPGAASTDDAWSFTLMTEN